MSAVRREYRSRDRCASEFKLGISVVSVSHVIFVCRERKRCMSEFESGLSRVPDRNINSTLLRKNSRNFLINNR